MISLALGCNKSTAYSAELATPAAASDAACAVSTMPAVFPRWHGRLKWRRRHRTAVPRTAPQAAGAVPTSRPPDPKAVVTRFLDALRKGNSDAAAELLTKLARQKTEESGRAIAPPADENVKIEVDNASYPSPDHKTAQVSIRWIDLDEKGKLWTDKATLTCRLESDGWRVAGFAAYVFEGEDPLFLNFEDLDDLAKKQQWLREELVRREKQAASSSPH
jgi:hypothetical protein